MYIEIEVIMGQDEFQTLLSFFKALANESRFKLLGILANRECSVEELAALLALREPTVSHHLAKLKELNLVQMRAEGNTHLYRLNPEGLQAMNKNIFSTEKMASLVETAGPDAWEQKVLGNYLDGQRLKEIPASHKKRLVILKWLVSQFDEGVQYSEARVNEIIQRHHPDFATLRREFIINKLMARENGVYWRVV
ncbi:MAG: hypothetical protein Fur0044_38240 [Anaerolineae bacterium]